MLTFEIISRSKWKQAYGKTQETGEQDAESEMHEANRTAHADAHVVKIAFPAN